MKKFSFVLVIPSVKTKNEILSAFFSFFLCQFQNYSYLCRRINHKMKEIFGKWFLDVAKYILTAMFLTTVLTDMEAARVLYITSLIFVVCLVIGYVLLREADKEKKKKEKRKNKNKK